MKKVCFLLIFVLLLSGCQAVDTFETVRDVYQVQSAPGNISLAVPATAQTVANDNGILYLCDGYEITVETMSSGNLTQTVQMLTGFAPDALTVMQTAVSGVNRYECVWSAAGESGDMVGRAVILDDGQYHYCVTVMSQAETAGELSSVWQELLSSVELN